jgi:hypothetical protein
MLILKTSLLFTKLLSPSLFREKTRSVFVFVRVRRDFRTEHPPILKDVALGAKEARIFACNTLLPGVIGAASDKTFTLRCIRGICSLRSAIFPKFMVPSRLVRCLF